MTTTGSALLRLEPVPYLPTGPEFAEVPASVLRCFGAEQYLVRCATGYVGVVSGEVAVSLDGRALHRTGLPAQRTVAPSADSDGASVWLVGSLHAARVRLSDGAVLWSAALPQGRYGAVVPLGDGSFALLATGQSVLRCRDDGGSLVPEGGWPCPGALALRLVGEGGVLLVAAEGPARVELWRLAGAAALRGFVSRELEDFVMLEVGLDETGQHFSRPEGLFVWDCAEGYLVHGLEAPLASDDWPALEPLDELPVPREPEPLVARRAAPAVNAPRPVPELSLDAARGPYLRALLTVLLAGEARPEPLANEALFALPLPPELEAWCAGFARRRVVGLSLGEFWASEPRERTDRRALGGAPRAIQLGVLGSGDEVVARVSSGGVRVVELSHEESAEQTYGALEGYLRHCVGYARECGEATSLDALLPDGDRDGD